MSGRVALVTGGARGIGAAIAEGLAAAGVSVAVSDIDREALASSRLDMPKLQHDVSEPESCQRVVAQVEAILGPIDILINNAAVGMGMIREEHFTHRVGIADIAPEQWRTFFVVNTMGPFLMTRLLAPTMAARGWGRVINITTSFFTMLNEGFAPYGPTKAALEAATAIWAKEFADTGVGINIVVPGGPTNTRMVPLSFSRTRDVLIQVSAMVAPVQWLSSDHSDGVTGRRFIAALWDADLAPAEAAKAAGAPAAWPNLTANVVWPEA